MLSTNSLSAFSAATTTVSPQPRDIRLVREQSQAAANGPLAKNAVPNGLPSIPPPRGSLINLSV